MPTALVEPISLRTEVASSSTGTRALSSEEALRMFERHDQLTAATMAAAGKTAPRLRQMAAQDPHFALDFDETPLETAPLPELVALMERAPNEFVLGMLAGAVAVRSLCNSCSCAGLDEQLMGALTGYRADSACGPHGS